MATTLPKKPTKKTSKKTLVVRLDEAQKAWYEADAAQKGWKVSDSVREALTKYQTHTAKLPAVPDPQMAHFLKSIAQIQKKYPPKKLIPADLAENYKEYLYGKYRIE